MSLLPSLLTSSTDFKNNFTATIDPSVNDDISLGYSIGSLWLNISTDTFFICADNSDGTAIWNEIGSGGGDLSLNDLLDVDAPTPIDKHSLKYNNASSRWENGFIEEDNLSLSDNTINNSSTLKHGFLPKLSGSSSQFLNGEGNFAIPSGIVNSYVTQSFSLQTSINVNHGFGVNPLVEVKLDNNEIIIPNSIIHNSVNDFTVNFTSPRSGVILASVGSPQLANYIIATGDYITTINDRFIEQQTDSTTVTLLSAIGRSGQALSIKNTSSGNITIDTTLSQLIDGDLSFTLSPEESITVVSDSQNWRIN